jgi:hypothetical protein
MPTEFIVLIALIVLFISFLASVYLFSNGDSMYGPVVEKNMFTLLIESGRLKDPKILAAFLFLVFLSLPVLIITSPFWFVFMFITKILCSLDEATRKEG